jgi:hypothetical protein
MPDDILKLAEQFSLAAAKRDAAAMGRISRAYISMYRRLVGQIEAIAEQAGGGQMTTGQLARLTRFNDLMAQIENELDDFARYTKVELSTAAQESIAKALSDSRRLIMTGAQAAQLDVSFNTLSSGVVTRLLGFLQDGSPLFERLSKMPGVNAADFRQTFIDGVGLGWNPRKIVAKMQIKNGQALTDALRMTRTANNYAYREATRATYVANPDIVQGWIWMAAINNPNTCMSCISMHGTRHTNDEVLNDHFNGRCTMLPIVEGFENPLKQNGEQWFNSQSEADQRAMMGPEKYQAYKDGKFSFEQLSRETENDTYGMMKTETPLKDLIGEE